MALSKEGYVHKNSREKKKVFILLHQLVKQEHFLQATCSHKEGRACMHGFLIGILEILQALLSHSSPNIRSAPHITVCEIEFED